MSLFKRIYQNLTRALPKDDQKQTRALPRENQNQTKNLPITLESANKVCSNEFQVFLIVGKQGYGKTTLIKNIVSNFSDRQVVYVRTLDDLDKSDCVLVIDDLKTQVFKSVITKLVDVLRIARHKNLTVILSHHIISHIPTELLQLCSKTIFFNTSFNAAVNTKLLNIVSRSKLETLHEIVLSLEKYHYIVVENNRIYGVFTNDNVSPIIGKPTNEIKVNNNNKNGSNGLSINNQVDLLSIIVQRVPEFNYLTVTQKIVTIAKLYPNLKPRVIAEIVGTTPQNTWKTLSLMRHNKL